MTQPIFVSLIDQYIAEDSFAGAALIAAQHGEIIHEHYAGEARPGLPSSSDVLWPLASISKLYTAAMVMRLVEQGTLTLNRSVCDVLPEFIGEGRAEVRLRHLLTHTSGLIYESPEMEQRLIAQTPMEELINEAYRAPLLFKPGSSISYADYNYLLAGHMAEVASGVPFISLVDQLLIEPMKLLNTSMSPPAAEHEHIAYVSNVMAEGTVGAMYNSAYALGLGHPAFGTVASARDLLRFGLHFAAGGPRIHSSATLRAMTSNQTGGVIGSHVAMGGISPDARPAWGLGFMLQTAAVPSLFCDLASPQSYGHGGASGCQLVIDPMADVVIAVLSNTHLRAGRERWSARMQSILNSVFAMLD